MGIEYPNKRDGLAGRQRYIGAAFMTGADTPTIGSVTPDTVLTNTNSLVVVGVGGDGYGWGFQRVVHDYSAGLGRGDEFRENQI